MRQGFLRWPGFVIATACTPTPRPADEPPAPAPQAAPTPPDAGAPMTAASDAGPDAPAAASAVFEECPLPEIDDAVRAAAAKACKVLETKNLHALRSVKSINDVGAGGFDPSEVTFCHPTANGAAWGVLLSKPRVSGNVASGMHELTADWVLAHVDASGKVATSKEVKKFTATPFGGTTFSGINNRPAVYDYDGDGEAEIVFLVGVSEHAGSGDFRGSVWTFKNGKVQEYAPAPSGIVHAADLDCDGRPDLTMDTPYVGAFNCSSIMHTSTSGPRLAAHSLRDGTFSQTDAVAAAAARAICPERPGPIDAVDQLELPDHVRCARLWGAPAADLEKQINGRCKPPTPDDSCLSSGPGVCVFYSTILEWARAAPPLTLE